MTESIRMRQGMARNRRAKERGVARARSLAMSAAFALVLCSCGGTMLHDVVILTSLGLAGKSVQALAIDPGNPSTLYAATWDSGVFRSLDAGKNWTQLSLVVSYPSALIVDPSATTTLYAGSGSGGVLKSTDGALSWAPANSGLTSTGIGAVVIDPATPSTLYAGTGNGVFKTANGGGSWSPANTGLTAGIAALAIDHGNTQVLYAACGSGVYKSTNGGGSWSAASTGIDNTNMRSLLVDPANPSAVYAGTWFSDPYEAKIFKSSNGGASWVQMRDRCGGGVLAFALDPRDSSELYAGVWGGAYYSADGGTSWAWTEDAASNSLGVFALAVDPVSAAVYAGTSDGVMLLTVERRPYGP